MKYNEKLSSKLAGVKQLPNVAELVNDTSLHFSLLLYTAEALCSHPCEPGGWNGVSFFCLPATRESHRLSVFSKIVPSKYFTEADWLIFNLIKTY